MAGPTRGPLRNLILGDPQADRVVPPTGYTAGLTLFSSATMAFLAVFVLALSLATDRVADRWADALARTATVRISAPADQLDGQTRAVVKLLATTPGVASARVLTVQEQRDLLAPWFGAELPIEDLPLPQLVEVTEDQEGYDPEGLRQRLAAEAPGAVLDDHTRWRRPLIKAADRLRNLGVLSIGLIAATTAAMITLAANAALSANARLIGVMRLVGAKDVYIARAFVRRFTLRALTGSAIGTVLGMITISLLPQEASAGGFLTGLGFQGRGWLWPLAIPPLAGLVAYIATRTAALRTLKELT